MTLPTSQKFSLKEILQFSTRYFAISKEDLLSDRQDKVVVKARHFTCYAMRKLSSASFPLIGRVLFKDHSTIVVACRKVKEKAEQDDEYAQELSEFIEALRWNISKVPLERDVFTLAEAICKKPILAINISVEQIRDFAALINAYHQEIKDYEISLQTGEIV